MVNGEKSKFETILQKQSTTVQVILIDIHFNSFWTKTPVILLLHKNPQKWTTLGGNTVAMFIELLQLNRKYLLTRSC